MRSAKASVHQLKDGCWRAQIELPRDKNTGMRKRKYSPRVSTRKEAEAEKLRMLIELGENPLSNSITLDDYVHDVYLPHKLDMVRKTQSGEIKGRRKRFKQTTYESYESKLRLYILPLIGSAKMTEIGRAHVRLVQDSAPSEAMVIEVRKVMSAVFTEAVYDEVMSSNPVDLVRPPDPSDYEPEPLDAEDVEVYLWHFRNTRLENAVLLVLGGAYRRGELAAINVEDIDLETGIVTIDDTYVPTRKGILHDTTKNHKPRRNKLPRFILARLRETLPSSGPVLTTLDGRRMRPDDITRRYTNILKTLPEGVPKIPLKNLRHTSLTLIFDASGNMELSASHAGHSSSATTRRYYVRPHGYQEDQAAESLDKLADIHGFGAKEV